MSKPTCKFETRNGLAGVGEGVRVGHLRVFFAHDFLKRVVLDLLKVEEDQSFLSDVLGGREALPLVQQLNGSHKLFAVC